MAVWNNQMVYYGIKQTKKTWIVWYTQNISPFKTCQARDGDIIVGNGRGGGGGS